jgi:hypothetical protein
MRRALIPLGLITLLLACTAPMRLSSTGSSSNDQQLNVTADRLIVVTVDNSGRAVLGDPGSTPHGYSSTFAYTVGDQARRVSAALARDYHLREVREWPIAQLKVQCLVFALPDGADRDQLLQALTADHRVKLAQPLQRFRALGATAADGVMPVSLNSRALPGNAPYNDPYFNLQHGFEQIHAAPAQQWSLGEGVTVAIIDTGVATAHPDLEGRITLARNFIDDNMKSFESDRHGTEVAGIIGADANNGLGIVGIAPAVRMLALKACEPTRPNSMDAVCNSFTLARALGAALDAHAQIVNLSLGGPVDPLLAQLVGYGLQHGVIFVGAVPESGRLDGFPLDVAGVIAVDTVGRSVHTAGVLHAPGRDIVSTAPNGAYDFVSGSSFAAAHVTGAIALLHARVPSASAGTLNAMLARSATDSGEDESINVCAALEAMQPASDCMHRHQSVATASAVR